ncbi:MAG: type II toxin-antitoxin system RelE/ParE family toxin [Candidatus Liptonbacteria bacterium]|nr:type II toxin-antitoxin system RelE/ParE family toxin [Candidatus Liptonbacteria bacterium]
MDRIQKALRKLSARERAAIKQALALLAAGKVCQLDIKKLIDLEGVYRIRTGDLRIIYRVSPAGEVLLLSISRRSEKTYKL